MSEPVIAVLSGGVSGEREVSRRSAAALFETLRKDSPAELFDVTAAALPSGLDPERHLVVSALHGTFGEDGRMQELLEAGGFSFAGSDAVSSRLCMDKNATKAVARSAGVPVAAGLVFAADAAPDAAEIVERLGEDLVVKPNAEGSSIGLHFARGEADLGAILAELSSGSWLVERRLAGRELTVGILHGRALGIVEILPKSGRFDYRSKYTKGLTDYRWPAELPADRTAEIRRAAERVFAACGCRDFGRVDFIHSDSEGPFFLEINTIPGLTETSLLPKSALCEELSFPALARELVAPARQRFFQVKRSSGANQQIER